MALGGGTFTGQTKILPGTYINTVSKANMELGTFDRGVAAMGLELNWGIDGEVFRVDAEDFEDRSLQLFGCDKSDPSMRGLRDLFKNIKTLYAYKLNSGGTAASNDFATAKYTGTAGNSIRIAILTDVDVSGNYDVQTIVGAKVVDVQNVSSVKDLKENDFVKWKPNATLNATAATAMTGGTNGTVSGTSHTDFLDKIESYSVNAIGCTATDESTKAMYCNFVKRLREDVGIKFQVVLYNMVADYEGVVNVKNKTTDDGWPESSLVYWTTGAIAGCADTGSNTNKLYDGEFSVKTNLTQMQLENAIKAGEFAFHNVDQEVRVLTDINSLVTVTESKGNIFKENTTIRVLDGNAAHDAALFASRYLGKIHNNQSGRLALWSDIVKHRTSRQDQGVIENFDEKDVEVIPGKDKKSVVLNEGITITGMMEKLYITSVIG